VLNFRDSAGYHTDYSAGKKGGASLRTPVRAVE